MASFTTSWHRFNTVITDDSGTGFSANGLIGTAVGTASLETNNSFIELSDPNIIDSSGTQLEFSSEIPSSGVIKGIQYKYHVSASDALLSPAERLRIYSKIGGSVGDFNTSFASSVVDGVTLTLGGSQDTLSLNNPTPTSVDNLRMSFQYYSGLNFPKFLFHGKTYDPSDDDTPVPAVRIFYDIPPKVTITTGKLNITSGKVSIA